MAKTQKWTASTFVSLVHENLTEKGHKVKKSDLNWAVKVCVGTRMKQAPWSDSRRPSNCSAGIPTHFLAISPE